LRLATFAFYLHITVKTVSLFLVKRQKVRAHNFVVLARLFAGVAAFGASSAFAASPAEGPIVRICEPVVRTDGDELERDHAYPIVRCVISDRPANQNAARANALRRSVTAQAYPPGEGPDVVEEDLDYQTLEEGDSVAPWFDNASLDYPFGLSSLEGMREVERFVAFYVTEGRGRIHSYFSRAGKYQTLILEELARQNAPKDLLWVVAIESNFSPTVRSRAGAAGLWQFMPRTARARGMEIGGGIDERLDPQIATREGVAYLLYQLERFGSWPLALAAYNAGSGHVRGQIREHGVTELDAMARYGSVYQGARSYAAKIIAIALIDRNREHFGFEAIVPDAPFEWDEVEIQEPVRLSLIADAAGVSAQDVIELNPALTGRAVPREGWVVRLPKGTFERFVNNYDRVSERYGKEHQSVTLRFGETPAAIAERYDIPERVLRAVNGFSSSDTVPYGSELVVPESSRRSRTTRTSSDSTERQTVVVADQEYRYTDRNRLFYNVRAPDSLEEIADFFGVSVYELAAWNELDVRSTLWEGMTLQIFAPEDFDVERAIVLTEDQCNVIQVNSPEWVAWRNAEASESRSSSRSRRTHTVRPGETVLRIASRYGVDAKDIVRWNRLSDSGHIVIGQELYVSPGR